MTHLFGAQGEAALATVLRRRPLAAFDFDGTLAPIVARPDDARMPADVALCLARLAERLPVAIVTGRSISDVRGRIGFAPHYVVGNHGAEDDTPAGDDEGLAGALEPLRVRLAAQARALADAGVRIEDKGLSLALHYRLAARPEAARALIDTLTAGLPPSLQLFAGKMVVNAMAAQAPDKGVAVQRLQARSGTDCVIYVGDDVNDEPVFVAAPPHWLTVRVGHDEPSRAQYFLHGIQEVVPLLERMLAQLAAPN